MNRKKTVLGSLYLLLAVGFVAGCGQQAAKENGQGLIDLGNGDYAAAIESFRKASEMAPDEFSIRYNLAMAYHLAGQSKNAVEELASALAVGEDPDEHRTTLALLQIDANQNEEAAQTLSSLIDKSPGEGQLHFLRGVAYLKNGENRKAAEDFDKAIELNAYDYRAMIAKASAIKNESPDTALDTLTQAAKVAEDMAGPDVKATIQWNLANVLIEMGLLDRAAQHLEKARTFLPEDENFIQTLAVVYQNLGDYAKAHQAYLLLPAEEFEDADSHLFLARLYYNQKDYTRALAEARVAEEKDGKNVDIVNLQGMIFARRGQIIPAIKEFERSLQISAEQPDIRRIIGLLKARR